MVELEMTIAEWISENMTWQFDPPQEFIDNWTRIFENRSDEALEPMWGDLWFLHNWVKKKQPRTILEFGSGCSTVIMAHALWYNRKGWIDSIENELIWLQRTERMMPSYLSEISTLYCCPAEAGTYNGEKVLRYCPSYPTKPDFIYLDGPRLFVNYKITINPFELEPSFPKGFTMVVDCREETVKFFVENFKRRYRVIRIYTIHNGLTIFELLE